MSRILIIESIGRRVEEDFSKTAVVHARNSVIIADILGADLLASAKDYELYADKTYDHIICAYASPYMKYKQFIGVIEDNPDATLWWLVNDHDLEDNILLRNVIKNSQGTRKFNMICNNPREGYRQWCLRKKMKSHEGEVMGLLNDFIVEWHTMNLNALIFNAPNDYNFEDKTEELIYFGTYRKWRHEDFLLYQGDRTTFSASKKRQQKFSENGIVESPFIDKLCWTIGDEDLKRFKFSLYIEDLHTHDNYAFMANRFYEALMCHVVTFFDAKCQGTIDKSEFDIDPYFVVQDRTELYKKMDECSDALNYGNAILRNREFVLTALREKREVTQALKGLFQ